MLPQVSRQVVVIEVQAAQTAILLFERRIPRPGA